MTKTISFTISNFAHWNLFVIWCLGFGAYTKYYHKKKKPFNPFASQILNDQNDFVWDFEFLSLDSYLVKSEDFLLTSYAPSPFPSPRWGEGGGEGKISNIFG